MKYGTCLVVGAGAFGTSIASVLARNFTKVILKVRSEDVYEGLKKGENTVYLPGVKLPKNLIGALTWEETDELLGGLPELVVSGLPTSAIAPYMHEHSKRFQNYLKKGIPFVSLSKGIDPETLEMPDDLFFDAFPNFRDLFVFLSGPSFAREIVEKQITLVTIAGRSRRTLKIVGEMMSTNYFKAMGNYDIKGTLLGGALKNILAIAGGIIEGLGYSHNTRAAMITRGIGEMLRYGKVFNARPETFYGLSGMGDLILTTTGGLSRNKRFGIELAKGRTPEEILGSQRTVVEGYKTTKAAFLLSERYEIRASIFNAVYKVLYEGANVEDVISILMENTSDFEIG